MALAHAFLSGEADAAELRRRAALVLGRKWPWIGSVVRQLIEDFGDILNPAEYEEIVGAIAGHRPFRAAFESSGPWPEVRGYFPYCASMAPPPAWLAEAPPPLATPGDLAHWLGLTPPELDWFADLNGWSGRAGSEALCHYRYRWCEKAAGGLRLIEIPKTRLREIQRRILHGILDRVPAHVDAHGCVQGRSALTNARIHAGRRLTIRLDLRDFFTSISDARVQAVFRELGYPARTARYLAALTTHRTVPAALASMPRDAFASPESRLERERWARRFTARHLPQGAPTSPALANLCAFRLDLRLAGAARTSGATYTRYVDDLFFSSDRFDAGHARRFAQMAYTIILEEGFAPNTRKTRFMPRGRAQFVTGLVVNRHPNISRTDYDCLKAILTNCARQGPAHQNRAGVEDLRAHLLGRVSYIEHVNPARGAKLRRLFDTVTWESP